MRSKLVLTLCLLAGLPAFPHRLDEYLQATIISLTADRVEGFMRLIPGVAVSSAVLSSIDLNHDSFISPSEQQLYAARVLADLSIRIDGSPLTPHLLSINMPPVDQMQTGIGEIQLEWATDLPSNSANRKLTFANNHHRNISAYLVNCLVPRDRNIKVLAQSRNADQSYYELNYVRANATSGGPLEPWWSGPFVQTVTLAALSLAALACGTAFVRAIGAAGVEPTYNSD